MDAWWPTTMDDRPNAASARDHSAADVVAHRRFLHGLARVGPLLAGLLLLAGCSTERRSAPPPPEIARIGYLGSTSLDSPSAARYLEAFRQGLSELGYVEGQTLAIESRFAEGSVERVPTLTAELLRAG